MIKDHDIYSPVETYSEYEEYFLNDYSADPTPLDYDYASSTQLKEAEISDSELMNLCIENYFKHSLANVITDKPSFFLFQAELFLNSRKYKEALSSTLCFEILLRPNLISKSIKMICFYQLNYTKNFNLLKEEILNSNLESLSDPLRKIVVGTIQVSTWIPELMNCLSNMKNTKS